MLLKFFDSSKVKEDTNWQNYMGGIWGLKFIRNCATHYHRHLFESFYTFVAKRISNSYKGKYLIGTCLQVQKFSSLSAWWEARQLASRHAPGEGA